MRTFDEEVQLIGLVEGADDEGFPVVKEGPKSPILANLLSIRSGEFWAAKVEGVKLSFVFEVHSLEYQGEEKLIYENEEHKIERTYVKGEYTELICSRKGDDHAT